MESLRNFLKSWPGRIFLILCLSPLALFGIEGYLTAGVDPNQLLKVGEQVITKAEYQNALNQQRNQLLMRTDPSLINDTVLKQQVLDSLIDAALIEQQTIDLGMSISDDTINDMLLQEPSFQDENGKFSNDRFAFYLQQRGMNKLQLFAELRRELNLRQLNNSILTTAVYPMKSINELIDIQEETRPVWVHRLAWEEFADDVVITEEEIQAYYDEHRQNLNSKAMVDLSYIVLTADNIDLDPITEEEIQQQYDSFRQQNADLEDREIAHILITNENEDALNQINNIKQQFDEGDSFSQLAKTYSEDEGSRDNGGNLGVFNPTLFGDDADIIEEALDGLEVGEASEPVQTSYGYHLFTIVNKNANDIPTIDDMREQLEEEALRHKKDVYMVDKITRINEMAVDGMSIEDIASQENLKVNHIDDYTKVDNNSILNQPAVIEAAFDEFNIQDHSVSTNININKSEIWVQPQNYRPVVPLSLEEAQTQIRLILVEQKASQIATVRAEKIANTVNNLGIEATPVTFVDLGMVTRQTPALTDIEKAAVFSQDVENEDLVATAQQTNNGASVLVIGAVINQLNQSMPENIRVQTAALIRDNRGEDQLKDYLHFLRETTVIERNKNALKEFGLL